jgi:hypothetical protein
VRAPEFEPSLSVVSKSGCGRQHIIKSIVVTEFGGIDHLPDDLHALT